MSFKIEKNESGGKIDPRLKQAAATIADAQADDTLLAIFVRASANLTIEGQTLLNEEGAAVKGVAINHIAGDIYTARVSRNSLKELEADKRIVSLQASQKLRPL